MNDDGAFEQFRGSARTRNGQQMIDDPGVCADYLDLFRDPSDDDAIQPEGLEQVFRVYGGGYVIEVHEDHYRLCIENTEQNAPLTEAGLLSLERALFEYAHPHGAA